MADSVIEKVLKKCREAVLGGIPIVYIKTNSSDIIKQLVGNEKMSIVVPLGCDGENNCRPAYELRERGIPYKIKNYRETLPEREDYGKADCPQIWVYRLPDDAESRRNKDIVEETFNKLEKYAADHENENYPNYHVLQSSVVILYSSYTHISSALRIYTEYIDVDYPDENEIKNIVLAESCGDLALVKDPRLLAEICTSFLGFSAEEIRKTVRRIMSVTDFENSDAAQKIISDRKKQKLEGGILELCSTGGNIAGMERYKKWLDKRADAIKNSTLYRRKNGTPPPKGVLLCGIPGCGKSASAKFTAAVLNLPLLKMDIGSLMDKYQGVSEQRMRDALKLAESMSPCVLFIDELEKGFSGASSGEDSSFKRMFGYMLSWMQDNTRPCFIFATANNISSLPKEFFRSGRFDALFAVYLPTEDECVNIFQSCMLTAEKNAAEETETDIGNIRMFAPECKSSALIKRVIDKTMAYDPQKPRIAISADIHKIVISALRICGTGIEITPEKWEKTLTEVLSERGTLYGDSEENINSIASSYCHMLRKGFIPSAETVLFYSADYHTENFQKLSELKNKSTAGMTKEQYDEHISEMKSCRLICGDKKFSSRYDSAVYNYLKDRINDIGYFIEQRERSNL